MLSGFVMFICSIIFAFFNLVLIELLIFIVLFIIPRITTIRGAKAMAKKYNEMNERKEKQQIFKDLERELAEEKEKEEKNKG
jgi:uncharacterized membrane protein